MRVVERLCIRNTSKVPFKGSLSGQVRAEGVDFVPNPTTSRLTW